LIRETCTVCGSSDARLFLREPKAEVNKCSACGHLFTRAVYVTDESRAARLRARSGWNVSDVENPRDSLYRWVLDSLKPDPARPGRRLLEVGCATGRFLELAMGYGFTVAGVEPSADVQAAQRRLPHASVVGGFFPDEFADTSQFDVVASFEVFEHIPNVEEAVSRVSQLLVPGGHFVGSVPNRAFHENKVWPRRALGIEWLGVPLTLGPDQHLNYFSPAGLTAVFMKYGLIVRTIATPPQTDFGLGSDVSKYLRRAYGSVARPMERALHRPLRTNFFWDAVKA
jgi:SAM-dependent methyltransferase